MFFGRGYLLEVKKNEHSLLKIKTRNKHLWYVRHFSLDQNDEAEIF